MKSRRLIVAVVLVVNAVTTVLRADHPPDWLVSDATPERWLARIEVGRSTVSQAVDLYGEPSSGGPIPGYSESSYTWDLPRSVVVAATMHPPDRPRDEQVIYSLEVREKPGRRSTVRTSAKIGMGSTFAEVVRAYGPKYLTAWREFSGGGYSGSISFVFENDTELSFAFSDEGRVVAIALIESQE